MYAVMYGASDVIGLFIDETTAYESIEYEPFGEDDVYIGENDSRNEEEDDSHNEEDDVMAYTVRTIEIRGG
jgi:hypothetical protein